MPARLITPRKNVNPVFQKTPVSIRNMDHQFSASLTILHQKCNTAQIKRPIVLMISNKSNSVATLSEKF